MNLVGRRCRAAGLTGRSALPRFMGRTVLDPILNLWFTSALILTFSPGEGTAIARLLFCGEAHWHQIRPKRIDKICPAYDKIGEAPADGAVRIAMLSL
jgi:hypothetical protein